MEKCMKKLLVYSDDHNVRKDVRLALGKKVPHSSEDLEIVETATEAAVLRALDASQKSGGDDHIDACVLDAEATPSGGLGISKQLHDEYDPVPPVLLLVARADDAWLAAWSRADLIHAYPIDPIELADQVSELLAMTPEQEAASNT
jgi:CheY-like chemotaxis protein